MKINARCKFQGGMGFRDTRMFNQALLARQAWRLIQNPNSLAAKLMKAVYYPRGNLVDTVFRKEASPVWRGIEHGLQLLKEGIIWRVGDGENIRIWRDNWLPKDYILKPVQGKTKARFTRVAQLTREGSNEWNEELIKRIFHSNDAETILNLNAPTQKNGLLSMVL